MMLFISYKLQIFQNFLPRCINPADYFCSFWCSQRLLRSNILEVNWSQAKGTAHYVFAYTWKPWFSLVFSLQMFPLPVIQAGDLGAIFIVSTSTSWQIVLVFSGKLTKFCNWSTHTHPFCLPCHNFSLFVVWVNVLSIIADHLSIIVPLPSS